MGYASKKDMFFDSSSAASLASAAVIKKFAVCRQVVLEQISFGVETAVVSSGAVIVSVKSYPVMGNAAGAVVLGTIQIPAGAAQGGVYYKNISPAVLAPGAELVFEVTTAAAGGGAAGAGVCMFSGYDQPEQPANIAAMIASA